ncbi:hypothetical protein PI125_g23338 [Phytophthora idaei]|nr:hypothetical protein PI125_g23338 [Phytophthora idaei]
MKRPLSAVTFVCEHSGIGSQLIVEDISAIVDTTVRIAVKNACTYPHRDLLDHDLDHQEDRYTLVRDLTFQQWQFIRCVWYGDRANNSATVWLLLDRFADCVVLDRALHALAKAGQACVISWLEEAKRIAVTATAVMHALHSGRFELAASLYP